ncbi:hypothetical protein ACGF12_28665 [Kitasatospora sp. NPDC048296]|uniref:hypothetical protein n=1 Tax=Kitasatospora sp. NPDC048296 TaxID=3364048 RepID=UPI00371172BC
MTDAHPDLTCLHSAYLHSAAWAFGRKRTWTASSPEAAERLAHERLEGYYEADVPPWQLAADSAAETLKRAGVEPTDLDLVIYASESTDSRVDLSRDPDRFAMAAGAETVPLLGATANVCANFGAALRIARNAIQVGDARRVLLVTTDVWDDRSRLVDAGTCLMSDAAASVLVTADRPDEGWLVGDIHSATDHAMHDVDPAVDTIAMVRRTAGGMRRAAEGFFASHRLRREDYPRIVVGNVGLTVLRVLAAAGGLDLGRMVTQTAQNGHCFAADVIVNLAEIEPEARHGDRVLALSTGHNYWTCVGLQRVAEQTR